MSKTLHDQPDSRSDRAQPLEWMRALPPPGKDLPYRQWVVLVRLALAMGRDGDGWVTLDRLAKEATTGVTTAQRAIRWACDAGRLERTRRGHRISAEVKAASAYQLHLPNRSPNDRLAPDPTGQNDRPNRSKREANRSPNDRLRGPSQEVLNKRSKALRARALHDIQDRAGVTADEAEEIITGLAEEREARGKPPVGDWAKFVAVFSADELRDRAQPRDRHGMTQDDYDMDPDFGGSREVAPDHIETSPGWVDYGPPSPYLCWQCSAPILMITDEGSGVTRQYDPETRKLHDCQRVVTTSPREDP